MQMVLGSRIYRTRMLLVCDRPQRAYPEIIACFRVESQPHHAPKNHRPTFRDCQCSAVAYRKCVRRRLSLSMPVPFSDSWPFRIVLVVASFSRVLFCLVRRVNGEAKQGECNDHLLKFLNATNSIAPISRAIRAAKYRAVLR